MKTSPKAPPSLDSLDSHASLADQHPDQDLAQVPGGSPHDILPGDEVDDGPNLGPIRFSVPKQGLLQGPLQAPELAPAGDCPVLPPANASNGSDVKLTAAENKKAKKQRAAEAAAAAAQAASADPVPTPAVPAAPGAATLAAAGGAPAVAAAVAEEANPPAAAEVPVPFVVQSVQSAPPEPQQELQQHRQAVAEGQGLTQTQV